MLLTTVRRATFALLTLALITGLLRAPLCGQAPQEDKKIEVYDPKADAGAQIARAVERGRRDNRRILLVFGGNWCGWCVKLHEVFKGDREIAEVLRNEYLVVPVDIGSFDKQMDLAASYGADLKKHGVPFLTVLGIDGKSLVNQNTSDLENGPKHDRAKVKAFLEKWKPEPLDAEAVLADALSRAKAAKKHVLLHLGAPW